jgi:excisionase family DNA binding protein
MAWRLLTVAEGAQLLAVRPSWVYDACRRELVPHVRLGKHVRFDEEELRQWLREQQQGGGKQ